jgi:putative transport protein
MTFFVNALRQHPELAVFITLALGFFIGRLKIGSFSLGTVIGTLLAGVLIGQLDIEVPVAVKAVFFDLFLFATGYKVGPQFFRGLRKNAFRSRAHAVVRPRWSRRSPRKASLRPRTVRMLAGAFTESTVIGTAGDAINRLDIPEEQKQRELNNIPMAYAVTYLVGTASCSSHAGATTPTSVDLRCQPRDGGGIAGADEEPGVSPATAVGRSALSGSRTPSSTGGPWPPSMPGSAANASLSSGSGVATNSSTPAPRRSSARATPSP